MEGKKRRIRIHAGLSFALAIVLTIVIAVVAYQRSGLLSYQLSRYVNDHYFRGTPFRFSCGRITGDLVSHVSVEGPVIRYEDDERSVKVFAADRVTIDYELFEVLKLKMIVSYLGFDNGRITVWHDDEGEPVFPITFDTAGPQEGTIAPHIEVKQFAVSDLEVMIAREDTTFSIEDIDLSGSFRYVQGIGGIEIAQGRARLVDRDNSIKSLRLEAGFSPDSVVVNHLAVRLDESFVMLSGRYENGRLHYVQGIFNPLNLDELASIGLIPDEKGEVGGSIVVEGRPDSLAVEGSLTGSAGGLVFSALTLKGVITPELAHMSEVEGEIYGCRASGSATYRRDTGGYSFEGICQDLDITHGFLPGEGIPETDLNGFVHLEHDGVQGTYEVRTDLGPSAFSGFEADEIQFQAIYRKKTGLDIRSVTFTRPGFVLRAFGAIDQNDEVDLILSLKGDDLGYLSSYLELPEVDGSVDLAGKLVGPLDGLRLNLNGSSRDLTYSLARIDSGLIHAEARGIRSNHATATVNIDGRRLDLGGQEFSDPHVLLAVGDGSVVVRDFSFSLGDTFFTANFEVEPGEMPGETETKVRVKHLAVRTPRSTWKNRSESTVTLTDAATYIDTLVLAWDGNELGGAGSYSTGRRRIDLRLWGRNLDLALVGATPTVPIRVEGSGRFESRIHGNLDNPYVDLSADVYDGAVDSLSFDRLVFDGRFSDAGYRIDHLCLHEGIDSLTVSGWWEHDQSPVAIMHSGLLKERALAARVSVDAGSQGYPVASILKAARRGFTWNGDFSGHVTMRGTLSDPEIGLAGVMSSKGKGSVAVPDIEADVVYQKGALAIRSISTDDGRNRASVTGTLPVDLDLRSGFTFNRDSPVELSADVDAGDLSIVAGYLDIIAASGGRLDGRLEVRGAVDRPRLSGKFECRDGAFRLTRSDEVYRDITATIRIEDNLVKLTSLAGRKGKKGRFSGQGTVRLEGFKVPEYALSANLTDFPFSTIPGYQSTQSGEITVTSRLNDQGKPVPFVGGKLDVKQAVITRSLAGEEGPPSPLTMATSSPSWLCAIDINAPKNVWVRNQDINMELGGDLVLKRDQKGLYLRGELGVLRGSYTLYNNKFRITEGRFDFATATTFRPAINLDAYTVHRRSGEVEERIFLNLSWPEDEKEPKITLSYSAPGYSETDIWAMLGGQVVAGSGALDSDGEWNAGETATHLASNYLEKVLNAQMSDMTIAVDSRPVGGGDRTGGGEGDVSIAVGRYLSEDLYLNYRQGLRVTSARELDVEYRLSNMLLLRSEIIQYSHKGLQGKSRQATDEINFDIKFRFEY